MKSGDILLQVRQISKNFSGNPALKSVNMTVHSGEIIGLVGENGAGKSTLLKILMGVQPPSSGEMILAGAPYAPRNPREANERGVGMVFQEQSLITNLTVGQNMFFGDEKMFSTLGMINYRKMYEQAAKSLAEVGLDSVRPEKYVRELNFATRQMVEIAKVINKANSANVEHALILLDEPTSVLNEQEVELLYSQVRNLASRGHSVIFVSHRLDEVLTLTDRIYVFRDAENAGEFVTAECREEMLYEAMVGRATTSEYYDLEHQRAPEDDVVLEAENLHLFGVFKDVSFQLHRGEILGICGVVGSGKEELCSVLCGDECATDGRMSVKGRVVRYRQPASALSDGITMIPQERNAEGVFGMLDITDNIAASSLEKRARAGFLSGKKLVALAREWIERLRIRTPGPKTPVSSLSGGNAQKVVFAKMLSSDSDVVLLNHPTRGVDVGAKVEIYGIIREMAQRGCSVILLGDTLDECIGLSNRVLVMKDGLITGEFDAPAEHKPEHLDIIQCMM
ncbi:sugar ABC transporter ATP-binding protein [Feifania hominis]|uniref:Sugar ABC transporter ATP-binding protein n=1 Tax=Feifania hominis TaxID=2763660 RepID=A0A926DBW6_9FIRM|nr:sugar ABC transporter ATP-binding protein [Feifania hominis]MBC8535381.1 sugar ABC transporter ATP-binding protein [Feifania hominis]